MDSSPSHSESGTNHSSTPRIRNICAYDAAFEQHLIDHGVLPARRNHVDPGNLDEIKERLMQRRPSLSPSAFTDEAFWDFVQKDEEAQDEKGVMRKVFPIIEGDADIPSALSLRCTNFAALTDGTLTMAQPDFYDGSDPIELDRRVRNQIGPHIIPSKRLTHPLLPNFSMEAEGPDGSPAVMRRQAIYIAALGARSMDAIQSFGEEGDKTYDGNAYTITSTYSSGHLRMYAMHPAKHTQSTEGPEYHMI